MSRGLTQASPWACSTCVSALWEGERRGIRRGASGEDPEGTQDRGPSIRHASSDSSPMTRLVGVRPLVQGAVHGAGEGPPGVERGHAVLLREAEKNKTKQRRDVDSIGIVAGLAKFEQPNQHQPPSLISDCLPALFFGHSLALGQLQMGSSVTLASATLPARRATWAELKRSRSSSRTPRAAAVVAVAAGEAALEAPAGRRSDDEVGGRDDIGAGAGAGAWASELGVKRGRDTKRPKERE